MTTVNATINMKYGTCVLFDNFPVRRWEEIPLKVQPSYQRIPNPEWGKWAIPDHACLRDIVEPLNLPGCYDYALPQDFFDQYLKENGVAPRGIWYYPPHGNRNHLFGEFVSLQSLLWKLANLAEATWIAYCQATLPA